MNFFAVFCIVFLVYQVSPLPVDDEMKAVLSPYQRIIKQLTDLLDEERMLHGDLRMEKEQDESLKEKLLEEAKEKTKALIEDQKMKSSKVEKGNLASKRLLKFLSATPEVMKASKSARTQLYAIEAYKEMWDKKRSAGATEADFWNDIKADIGPTFLKKHHETRQTGSTNVNDNGNLLDVNEDECPLKVAGLCDSTDRYRTIDGTCNNLEHPLWGSANRAEMRLLDPEYEGSVEDPRQTSVGGVELTSARTIRETVNEAISYPNGMNTLLIMSFGQFMDHDISHTPVTATEEGDEIDCGADNCDVNEDCFPIKINSTYCMKFVRSVPFLSDECTIGPREQLNTITSFLDASNVYGSSEEELEELWDTDDEGIPTGFMKVETSSDNPKGLLPFIEDEDSGCTGLTETIKCFHAGDVRQNEQPGLMAMHTVFVRMHNVIATKLTAAYKDEKIGIDGETLFQETRKILIGFWQQMIFNEYLPVILGEDIMENYGLKIKPGGESFKDYDPDVRADTINAFAAAAFRFGHTEVADMIRFSSDSYQDGNELHLSEVFFNPTTVYNSPIADTTGMDAIVLGQISARSESYDGHFATQISNHLFTENPPFGDGFDLPALNIQRARDHGIPGYIYFRQVCGIDEELPTDFDELKDLTDEVIQKLKVVYDDVKDIDLFPAAISEEPLGKGGVGIVGPTFSCLIAQQFKRLKYGDRFFYENDNPRVAFTGRERKEVRKFTLARLLCETLDQVSKIQPFVFLQPVGEVFRKEFYDTDTLYKGDQNENRRRPCERIRDIDYSVFVRDNL